MSMASVVLIVIVVAGVCTVLGVHFFFKSKNRNSEGLNEIIPETKPEIEEEKKEEDERGEEEGEEETTREENERTSISPSGRGGRSRGKHPKNPKEVKPEESHHRRPEIMCLYRNRKWDLGVENISNESKCDYEVKQNGEALTDTDGLFLIESILSKLAINNKSTNLEFTKDLAYEHKHFLIFKLSSGAFDSGRLVRYATKGNYLVIVTRDWSRNEEKSGIASLQPCDCNLDDYQAHFFHLDSNNKRCISFWNSEGKEIQIPSDNLQFELNGNKLCDANEEMGPLFGNGELNLVSNQSATIEQIKTIVIGEEGIITNRWKKEFEPVFKDRSVNVSEQLNDRLAGWYFLRLYNSEYELEDSLDFRFVPNLRKITIAEHNVFPAQNSGHLPIQVIFESCAAEKCVLELIEPESNETTPETKKLNQSQIEIIIPNKPEFDKTKWKYRSETNSQVNLVVLVERIWWDVSSDGNRTWNDVPIGLSRDEFRATSNFKLCIKLPKRRWTDKVRVGFKKDTAREYMVKVDNDTVEIPLNQFEGDELLENEDEFYFKLFLQDNKEQVVAIIKRVEYTCMNCGHVLTADGIREHFVESHQYNDNITKVTNWEEYVDYYHWDRNLPFRIYLCGHCKEYVRAMDRNYRPLDKILEHLHVFHWGETAEYRDIRDVEEISKLIPDIKPLYRCNLDNCKTYFESLNENEIWVHLLTDHKNQFIKRTG